MRSTGWHPSVKRTPFDADRKVPKVVSPVDPSSAWTAKANKRVQFGYGLNYLIDLGPHAVIVDVEGTPARTYDEVAATKTMINRTEETFGLKLKRLAADTAYGTGKLLAWLLEKDITPHIPVALPEPSRGSTWGARRPRANAPAKPGGLVGSG